MEHRKDHKDSLPLINFDPLLPSDNKKKIEQHPLTFQYQFGAIISGRTGSGKTNMLANVLTKHLKYDSCYIFLKDTDEPIYRLMEAFFEKVKKKNKDFTYLISDSVDDIPDLNDLDPNKQHVFVFDDLINSQQHNELIKEYAIRSRKRGVSWFYLTQAFFDIPKIIRDNANYVCLYRTTKKEVTEFFKTFGTNIDKEEFYRIFNAATKKRYNFLLIDLKTDSPLLNFRTNFDGIGHIKE